MLGSINSEACYANTNEMVHVLSNCRADIVLLQGQIKKARQATVPDLESEGQKTPKQLGSATLSACNTF